MEKPKQLPLSPELFTKPSELITAYVADIELTAIKDTQMIELQEWGIKQCGWKRP